MVDRLIVSGARGASAADVARRTGLISSTATDADFIAYLAGLTEGIDLEDFPASAISYTPAPAGAVAETVQDKLRRLPIDIEEFGGGTAKTGVENVDALRAAMVAFAAAGGGTLQFGLGTYNLDSVTLGGAGISVASNVTIQGKGEALTRLVIAGTENCYLFFNGTSRVNITIQDMTARGNGVASDNSAGSFFWVRQANLVSTAQVVNNAVRNVRLENFKGDQIIWFLVDGGSYGIARSGVENVSAFSESGNVRNPNNIGVLSSVVSFRAAGPEISDCFALNLYVEGAYRKQGVSIFGNVRGTKIIKPAIYDIFQGHQVSGVGAYGILLYDTSRTDIVTNTIIDQPTITNPYSNGIYLAGAKRTRIIAPQVSGQNDEGTPGIPRAAILISTTNDCVIVAPTLFDNYRDIIVNGIATAAYSADMRVRVIGGTARNSGAESIRISYSSMLKEDRLDGGGSDPGNISQWCGGVHFDGFTVEDAAGEAVALWAGRIAPDPAAPAVFEPRNLKDIVFNNCTFGSQLNTIDLNQQNYTEPYENRGVIFRNCRVTQVGATRYSVIGAGANSGNLDISDCDFEGPGAYHIVLDASTNVKIERNRFTGAVTAANMDLPGTRGILNGNVALNGSTLVASGSTPLGRAKPVWSGQTGMIVQNALVAAGEYERWRCMGTTTWKGVGLVEA